MPPGDPLGNPSARPGSLGCRRAGSSVEAAELGESAASLPVRACAERAHGASCPPAWHTPPGAFPARGAELCWSSLCRRVLSTLLSRAQGAAHTPGAAVQMQTCRGPRTVVSSGHIFRPTELEHVQCPGWFWASGSCCVGRKGRSRWGCLAWGRESAPAALRCWSACRAEEKLGFCRNWAALEVRPLKPVRRFVIRR